MSNSPGSVILFTAFEPSGDAHAAPLIAALKEKAPDLRIFAWGGPKMEAAGAEMMGQTCDDGAMGRAVDSDAGDIVRVAIEAYLLWHSSAA